jgi:hypothetical protein
MLPARLTIVGDSRRNAVYAKVLGGVAALASPSGFVLMSLHPFTVSHACGSGRLGNQRAALTLISGAPPMERAGLRYKNLASRCRQSAAAASAPLEREALLRMAAAYDRRAMDLETDFYARVEEPTLA